MGIRPGEKVHEILVSEEEAPRTTPRGDFYVISSILPELRGPGRSGEPLGREYSSADHVVKPKEVVELLQKHGLLAIEGASFSFEEDLLV